MNDTIRTQLSHYKEVYFDGTCHYFDKNQLAVRFSGYFYRFQQFNEVIKEAKQSTLLKIITDPDEITDVHLIHFYNKELRQDGFRLNITSDHTIKVESSNLRGFTYAMQALNQIIIQSEHLIVLPVIEIGHEPSFEMRGVIEGFYGIPWTKDDRLDVLRYMGQQRLNTYMYAPKDDELQRKRWRDPYPEAKLAEFSELLQIAEEERIDFYYMISPGNDIDYTQPSEVAVLTEKLQSMINLGVRHFGLLLDDIDYVLKGNAKRQFKHAASAHAYLIRQVDDYLATVLEDYELVVCPTEYDNRFASEYLTELTQAVPQHIPFFWTGPSTLAREITTSDIANCAAVYQRPMIIWDNTPVNDFEKDHELIFLSPFENRSPLIADSAYRVLGFVSNPMAQWELSKLTVGHMSHYLWNAEGFDFIGDWTEVLTDLVGSATAEALKTFAEFNPNRHTRIVYPEYYLMKLHQKDHRFIERELEDLKTASEQLATVSNQRFREQLAPWLERVKQDLALWTLIQSEDSEMIASKVQELAAFPHRIGLDLPMKYYVIHLRDNK